MSTVQLRRYHLPSIKGEGWAIIVIGTDGYFSAVSDWGNYAFIWSAPGGEFRAFLTRLNPEYFHSKITHMRESEVWDDEQTEKNIRERLDELVADGTMTKETADFAFDEAEGHVYNTDALCRWASEQDIPEEFCLMEGIAATKPEPNAWGFATKVLPRFQELLRAELEAERSAHPISNFQGEK